MNSFPDSLLGKSKVKVAKGKHADRESSKKEKELMKEVFAPVNKNGDDGPSREEQAEQNKALLDKVLTSCTGRDLLRQLEATFRMHPLLIVASLGHDVGMAKLLSVGVSVNTPRTPDGNSALHLATKNGHLTIISHLLSAGADLIAENEDGYNAFMIAVESGNSNTVNHLWKFRKRFNINKANAAGHTALIIAAKRSWDSCVKLLIAGGASKNYMAADGKTALIVAAQNGDKNTVEKLVESGASILVEDNTDCTAICVSIREEKYEIAKYLIKKLSNTDQNEYVQRRVELLSILPDSEDTECFFEDTLYCVFRFLVRNEDCKELLHFHDLFLNWVPVIRRHIPNESATDRALHFIAEAMSVTFHPSDDSRGVNAAFTAEFISADGPDLCLATLSHYKKDTSNTELLAAAILPLLPIVKISSGYSWLQNHYYKIIEFLDIFDEEKDDLDYVSTLKEKVDTLWKDFKKSILKIQAVQADINGAELVAREEREKAKKERKRERRRQRRILQRAKARGEACDAEEDSVPEPMNSAGPVEHHQPPEVTDYEKYAIAGAMETPEEEGKSQEDRPDMAKKKREVKCEKVPEVPKIPEEVIPFLDGNEDKPVSEASFEQVVPKKKKKQLKKEKLKAVKESKEGLPPIALEKLSAAASNIRTNEMDRSCQSQIVSPDHADEIPLCVSDRNVAIKEQSSPSSASGQSSSSHNSLGYAQGEMTLGSPPNSKADILPPLQPDKELRFDGYYASDLPVISSKSFENYGITFGADISQLPQAAEENPMRQQQYVEPMGAASLDFVYDPTLDTGHLPANGATCQLMLETDFPPIESSIAKESHPDRCKRPSREKVPDDTLCPSIWDIENVDLVQVATTNSQPNSRLDALKTKKLPSWADLLKPDKKEPEIHMAEATASTNDSPPQDTEKKKSKTSKSKAKRRGQTLSLGEFLKPEALMLEAAAAAPASVNSPTEMPSPDSEFWKSVDPALELVKEITGTGEDSPRGDSPGVTEQEVLMEDKGSQSTPAEIQREAERAAQGYGTSNPSHRQGQIMQNANIRIPPPVLESGPQGFVPHYFPGMYPLPHFIDEETKAMIYAKQVFTDGVTAMNCMPTRFNRNAVKPLIVQWVQSIMMVLSRIPNPSETTKRYLLLLESYVANLHLIDWNSIPVPRQASISVDLDLVLLSQVILLTSHYARNESLLPQSCIPSNTPVQAQQPEPIPLGVPDLPAEGRTSTPMSTPVKGTQASPAVLSPVLLPDPEFCSSKISSVFSNVTEAVNNSMTSSPMPASHPACQDELEQMQRKEDHDNCCEKVVVDEVPSTEESITAKEHDDIKEICPVPASSNLAADELEDCADEDPSIFFPSFRDAQVDFKSLSPIKDNINLEIISVPPEEEISPKLMDERLGIREEDLPSISEEEPETEIINDTKVYEQGSQEKITDDPATDAVSAANSLCGSTSETSTRTPSDTAMDGLINEVQGSPIMDKVTKEKNPIPTTDIELGEGVTLANEIAEPSSPHNEIAEPSSPHNEIAEPSTRHNEIAEPPSILHNEIAGSSTQHKEIAELSTPHNEIVDRSTLHIVKVYPSTLINEGEEASTLHNEIADPSTPHGEILNLPRRSPSICSLGKSSSHNSLDADSSTANTPIKSQLIDLSGIPSSVEGSPEFLVMDHDPDVLYDKPDPDYIPGTIIKKRWMRRKGNNKSRGYGFFAGTDAFEKLVEKQREKVRQNAGHEVYGYNRPAVDDEPHVMDDRGSGDFNNCVYDDDEQCHYWLPSDIAEIAGEPEHSHQHMSCCQRRGVCASAGGDDVRKPEQPAEETLSEEEQAKIRKAEERMKKKEQKEKKKKEKEEKEKKEKDEWDTKEKERKKKEKEDDEICRIVTNYKARDLNCSTIFPYASDARRSMSKKYRAAMPEWSRWRSLLNDMWDPNLTDIIGRIRFPKEEFIEKFSLGDGKRGNICLGYLDGHEVSVRRINRRRLTTNENALLRLCQVPCQHRNICNYLAVEVDPDFIYLATELCELNLSYYMNHRPSVSTCKQTLESLVRELVEGMKFLHWEGIAHGRLTTENVLIDTNGVLRICDFGINDKRDGLKVSDREKMKDIKAMGKLIVYILTEGQCSGPALKTVLVDYDKDLTHEAKHLLSYIFTSRPTFMKNVLSHPYFWVPERKLDFFTCLCNELPQRRQIELFSLLEEEKNKILEGPWLEKIDAYIFVEMLKTAKTKLTDSIQDLLMFICYIHKTWNIRTEKFRSLMGEDGASFFLTIFPKLFITVYTVALNMSNDGQCALPSHFLYYLRKKGKI